MSSEPSIPAILVVDDNPHNLEVLSDLLQQRGYRVRVATSGRRGLEAARHDPPDLILLDLTMPDMSGFEVCSRLKQDPDLAGIPVIFISAQDEDDLRAKAIDIGGADYIQKPFRIQEVIAKIGHHLHLVMLGRNLQADTTLTDTPERLEPPLSGRAQEP